MLEQIYLVTQIFAAAGVIAGLFFVGLQINQNTKALRSASFHGVTDSFNSINIAVGSSKELARVTRTAFERGLSDLDEDERTQFSFTALSVFRVMETLFYQARIGVAERKLWEAEEATLRFLANTPGIKEWWLQNNLSFTKEFRQVVEGLVER